MRTLALAAALLLPTPLAMAAPAGSYTLSSTDYNKPTNIALGWHFAHANDCGWFEPPSGDQWFFILPANSSAVKGTITSAERRELIRLKELLRLAQDGGLQ